MSEFDPPRGRRQRRRVEQARLIIGSFEHEQQIRTHMNAVEVTKGIGEEWHEAREDLYDFYARYGKPVLERTDIAQQDFDSHGERWDVV